MILVRSTLTGIVLCALLAVPLSADAQPPSVPRVGVLSPGKSPPDDAFRQREHFEAGLRELGWTPGSNVVIDYRYADGILDRLPALAAELVRLPVNVIVARGLTIRAARDATAAIPIVMAADPDPVRSGFVASLARPGGNVTGLSTLAPDLEAKQLELLRGAPVTSTGRRAGEREFAEHRRDGATRSGDPRPAPRAHRIPDQQVRPTGRGFCGHEAGRDGCGPLPLRSVVHRPQTSGCAGSS